MTSRPPPPIHVSLLTPFGAVKKSSPEMSAPDVAKGPPFSQLPPFVPLPVIVILSLPSPAWMTLLLPDSVRLSSPPPRST